jgi:pyrroline-5-carboxylate reductase
MRDLMANYTIGFIGAGRMATALARGVVASQFATAGQVIASDPSTSTLGLFAQAVPGAATSPDNRVVASGSGCVVLAVKPQTMSAALGSIAGSLGPECLVVSIAAGVTIATLASGLPKGTRIVRVMPNTPALVGCGASAFAVGEGATEADREFVASMLAGVGWCCEVPERLLDAVTGLSGSGPAFVYTVIEALADGGVQAGLPRDVASRLAAETVAGAAAMVVQTGEHPAALRDAVASPGGTTIAGLAALESAGVRSALMSAVMAAAQRSRELGQ